MLKLILTSLLVVATALQYTDGALSTPKGAMVNIDFKSVVGYNLDDIPVKSREAAIDYITENVTEDEWLDRARYQVKLTIYRQVFRTFYYAPLLQLTLPPEQVWQITFTSEPYETIIEKHIYVARDYKFFSVLIGSESSISASEPKLAKIGGKFKDNYFLPADPEHIFQRTGYACLDEASFPYDTVNSENAWSYYDQECGVEAYTPIANRSYALNQQTCHWTSFPDVTCRDAISNVIGTTNLRMTFTRVAWDEKIASNFRYGEMTQETADLEGIGYKLEEEVNIGYKYFEPSSCVLTEGGSGNLGQGGCIDKPGWRQLFRFTSSSVNKGKSELHLGNVYGNDYIQRGIFEFNTCHLHYHFQHYENYLFGAKKGRKTGFCLQTTWRYYNNEWTDFNTPYSFCSYQGISSGWGDDYYQGLDCQWVDVTGVQPGKYNVDVLINPDNFICEGNLIVDSNNQSVWLKTPFLTLNGSTVYRQACNFTKNYDSNNKEEMIYDFKGRGESLVTSACKRSATVSPTKDCGFKVVNDNLKCTANTDKTISVKNTGSYAVVVRVCESSYALGQSTMCEYKSKLANTVINAGQSVNVTFPCPSYRASDEPGGLYSILSSPLLPTWSLSTLTLSSL